MPTAAQGKRRGGILNQRRNEMKHTDKIDMSFKYTPSRLTDIPKKFAMMLRKQKEDAAKAEQAKPVKVLRLRKG